MYVAELDFGNTRCKWRIVDEVTNEILCRGITAYTECNLPTVDLQGSCKVYYATVTGEGKVDDVLRRLLANMQVTRVTRVASTGSWGGVQNGYEHPERLGVDRWLAIIAAVERYRGQCTCIVDSGSALTLDLVDQDGHHLGGYIVPGLELARRALGGGTAGVGVHEGMNAGLSLGTNTASAVANGTLLMLCGLVRMTLGRQGWLCGEDQLACKLVYTGGDGDLLSRFVGLRAEYVGDLVLDGIRLLRLSSR